MKKISVFLFLAISILSCNNLKEDEYQLDGKIVGIPDGKYIYLERFDDSIGPIKVDSVIIKNEKFTFKGKFFEPEMHSLRVEDNPNSSYVIIENGKINIEIIKDSTFQNKLSGTYNNDEFFKFNKKGIENDKKKKDFAIKYQQKFIEAQNNNDLETMNKIQNEYNELENQIQKETEEYITSHPKALISGLLIKSLFNGTDPNIEQITRLYNGLDNSIKNSKVGKYIAKRLNESSKVEVNKQAPNFSAPNPEGKMVSLKESLGKVTIIDFWASWCKPCRMENPEMVKLYNEFHSKGLNILGVSLDKDADKWKEAISSDNLTWNQVSNLKQWEEPIAKLYSVDAIPSTFLLDSNGIIIAKNLRGEELKNKIKELLSTN